MDWSKAKTILIIVLLAVCLCLSGILLFREAAERKETAMAASYAREYLEYQGVSFNCDVPVGRPKLPVIFITMQNAASSEQPLAEFGGYPVCWEEGRLVPVLGSAGKGKAKVGTASSALLAMAGQLLDEDASSSSGLEPDAGALDAAPALLGLEINSIDLVYYADVSAGSAGAKDTALPSWRIETSKGVFYINAF